VRQVFHVKPEKRVPRLANGIVGDTPQNTRHLIRPQPQNAKAIKGRLQQKRPICLLQKRQCARLNTIIVVKEEKEFGMI
jgi:hypothetical protein